MEYCYSQSVTVSVRQDRNRGSAICVLMAGHKCSGLVFAVFGCARGCNDEDMMLCDVATPAQLQIGP